MDTTQTVTIDNSARSYVPTWDGEFAKDLAAGNSSVRKAALANGNSILKIKQGENGSVESHSLLLRDRQIIDTIQEQEQVTITVTNRSDSPASILRAAKIVAGIATKLGDSAFVQEFLSGQM